MAFYGYVMRLNLTAQTDCLLDAVPNTLVSDDANCAQFSHPNDSLGPEPIQLTLFSGKGKTPSSLLACWPAVTAMLTSYRLCQLWCHAFLLGFLATFGTGISDAQNEVDDNGQQQNDGQDRWTEAIVKPSLALDPYRSGSPMVREEGIYHGEHGDTGE